MNTRTSSILLIAAAMQTVALLPAFGAPAGTPAIGYRASTVTAWTWNDLLQRSDTRVIRAGIGRADVLSAMGEPTRQLAPDVWLYEGYQPDLAEAEARGCTLLVVTFAQDRVADLKFVNAPAAEVIAAQTDARGPNVIATSR